MSTQSTENYLDRQSLAKGGGRRRATCSLNAGLELGPDFPRPLKLGQRIRFYDLAEIECWETHQDRGCVAEVAEGFGPQHF